MEYGDREAQPEATPGGKIRERKRADQPGPQMTQITQKGS